MSVNGGPSVDLFQVEDNARIDRSLPPLTIPAHLQSTKTLSTNEFLDSYLALRSPPCRRPDPHRPYTAFDVLIFRNLQKALQTGRLHLSGNQLLDAALLFPPDRVRDILLDRADDITSPLCDLCNAVESGSENASFVVQTILNLVQAGAGTAVKNALSKKYGDNKYISALRRWVNGHDMSSPNDMAIEQKDDIRNAVDEIERLLPLSLDISSDSNQQMPLAEKEQMIRNILPETNIDDVRAALIQANDNPETAVSILLGEIGDQTHAAGSSSTPQVRAIGKRTEKRRHVRDVRDMETFSGEPAEPDGGYGWIEKRISAEMARQATIDPDDPRDHTGAYTFLVDGMVQGGAGGMYDDDPDDTVLDGEALSGADDADRYWESADGTSAAPPSSVPNSVERGRSKVDNARQGERLFDMEISEFGPGDDDEESKIRSDSRMAGSHSQTSDEAPPAADGSSGRKDSGRSSRGGGRGRGDSRRQEGLVKAAPDRASIQRVERDEEHRQELGKGRGRGLGRGLGRGHGRGRGRGRGRDSRGGREGRRDAAAKKQSRSGF